MSRTYTLNIRIIPKPPIIVNTPPYYNDWSAYSNLETIAFSEKKTVNFPMPIDDENDPLSIEIDLMNMEEFTNWSEPTSQIIRFVMDFDFAVQT